MPIEILTLPTSEKIQFISLKKWPNVGDFIYLQSVRTGRMQEDAISAQTYKNMAPTYARNLAGIIKGDGLSFDDCA
jgi:hypothetical protein